jgi:hypothetical protein
MQGCGTIESTGCGSECGGGGGVGGVGGVHVAFDARDEERHRIGSPQQQTGTVANRRRQTDTHGLGFTADADADADAAGPGAALASRRAFA